MEMVSQHHIDTLMARSKMEVTTVFDKCTVVSLRLPNGFVLVESSACVEPEYYSHETGISICLEKLERKIWELEGYLCQQRKYESERKK